MGNFKINLKNSTIQRIIISKLELEAYSNLAQWA